MSSYCGVQVRQIEFQRMYCWPDEMENRTRSVYAWFIKYIFSAKVMCSSPVLSYLFVLASPPHRRKKKWTAMTTQLRIPSSRHPPTLSDHFQSYVIIYQSHQMIDETYVEFNNWMVSLDLSLQLLKSVVLDLDKFISPFCAIQSWYEN